MNDTIRVEAEEKDMVHVEVLRRMRNEWPLATDEGPALDAAIASLSAPQTPAEAQPVEWQYQDRNGKWHGFTDESHRLNTIEDGSWPVRALYAHPPPSAPVGVEGLPEEWRREAPRARVDVGEDASLAWREAVYWCAFQLEAALAQRPAPALTDVDDDDLTVAYMAGRYDGRKEAQKPAAVDGSDAKDAEIEDLVKANEQVQKLALDVLADRDELKAEIESLRAKTAMTMGVGTGDGKLFVHGDCESIEAAQKIVLERDALRTELREAWAAADSKARAERMGEALRELSQCDGSPANVLNAEVLAGRVRSIATKALLDHDQEVGNE